MAQRYTYQGSFLNKEGLEILVEIQDLDFDLDAGDTLTTVDITFYAPALVIETYNTSEDEFSPIIGTRAFFQIRSTNDVNFSTFTEGRDQRWFIRASYDSETKFIFTGFIDMDDNQRPFLPTGQAFTISATDNLGALRNIPLSDFNNAVPDFTSKQKVITVIQWCLHKTGLRDMFDDLFVVNNLFEENHEDRSVDDSRCALNQTFIHVIDLCKSPNEFLDCHTVLTRLLFSCGLRVCQYNNAWYIFRIDEYRNGLQFDYSTYSPGGSNPESGTIGAGFGKLLDDDEIDLVKAETIERIRRPHKQSIVRRPYRFSKELLRNSTFVRGAVDDDVLPLKTYQIDDWELRRGFGANADTPNCEARIWRRFNAAGYENERYAVLTPAATTAGEQNYIISTDIPVCENDKFTFSFDYSADTDNSDPGPATINIAGIELEADDGSFYLLGDNINVSGGDQIPEWKTTDAEHATNNDLYRWFLDDTEDFTEWRTYSIESPPIPETGVLRVFFFAANQVSGAIDNFAIRYNNVRFSYSPYINGTYKELSGEQFKMTQEEVDDYSATFDEEFFLFDAQCKSFEGAMMYESGGDYFGTSLWFDRVIEAYAAASMPASMEDGERFLRWQMFSVWNQIRRSRRIFQFSLWGYDTANGHCGVIHQYTLQGFGLPIGAMTFLLLSMRQNWHDCTWTATMIEIDYTLDRRQEGTFEFKYLEDE